MEITCFSCQASFKCGADDPLHRCFCKNKLPIPIDARIASCLCESCLEKKLRGEELSCFRFVVAYVGSAFSGFQEQAKERTVEGEFKKALSALVGKYIKMEAAGRTDAKVHARGQVISATFITRLSPRALTFALLAKLPKDIVVKRVDKMPLGFDARRQSVGKRYVYRILQDLVPDPFLKDQVLHFPAPLDIDAMKKAALYLVGENDYESFRGSQCTASHARRYLWHVGVEKHGSLIEIDVRGNAFCLNMVRIMVGTLIEVGRGRRSIFSVKEAIEGKNRKLAGITAKPHGLCLEEVYYPDNLDHALIPQTAIFPRFPVTDESWGFNNADILYGP